MILMLIYQIYSKALIDELLGRNVQIEPCGHSDRKLTNDKKKILFKKEGGVNRFEDVVRIISVPSKKDLYVIKVNNSEICYKKNGGVHNCGSKDGIDALWKIKPLSSGFQIYSGRFLKDDIKDKNRECMAYDKERQQITIKKCNDKSKKHIFIIKPYVDNDMEESDDDISSSNAKKCMEAKRQAKTLIEAAANALNDPFYEFSSFDESIPDEYEDNCDDLEQIENSSNPQKSSNQTNQAVSSEPLQPSPSYQQYYPPINGQQPQYINFQSPQAYPQPFIPNQIPYISVLVVTTTSFIPIENSSHSISSTSIQTQSEKPSIECINTSTSIDCGNYNGNFYNSRDILPITSTLYSSRITSTITLPEYKSTKQAPAAVPSYQQIQPISSPPTNNVAMNAYIPPSVTPPANVTNINQSSPVNSRAQTNYTKPINISAQHPYTQPTYLNAPAAPSQPVKMNASAPIPQQAQIIAPNPSPHPVPVMAPIQSQNPVEIKATNPSSKSLSIICQNNDNVVPQNPVQKIKPPVKQKNTTQTPITVGQTIRIGNGVIITTEMPSSNKECLSTMSFINHQSNLPPPPQRNTKQQEKIEPGVNESGNQIKYLCQEAPNTGTVQQVSQENRQQPVNVSGVQNIQPVLDCEVKSNSEVNQQGSNNNENGEINAGVQTNNNCEPEKLPDVSMSNIYLGGQGYSNPSEICIKPKYKDNDYFKDETNEQTDDNNLDIGYVPYPTNKKDEDDPTEFSLDLLNQEKDVPTDRCPDTLYPMNIGGISIGYTENETKNKEDECVNLQNDNNFINAPQNDVQCQNENEVGKDTIFLGTANTADGAVNIYRDATGRYILKGDFSKCKDGKFKIRF